MPDGGPAEAHAAVEAAAGAFLGWSRLPGMERGQLLAHAHQLMMERGDDLARLVTQENGKPLEEARKEVAFAAGYFHWFAEEARRVYGAIVPAPSPQHRLWVLKQPLGVVAAITPWNFPATMVTRKIAPALAAGCPVVLKPASATPLTALALAEILHEAGLPAGVINVVVGQHSSPLAEVFVRQPQVRKIAFTGSTEVGKALMAQAAQQLKRVAFELGGNAPFVVCEDADLREAIEGAAAIKFMRVAGQSCICANRIYVQESIAAHFIPAFIDRVRAIKVGEGFQPGVEVGPLINEATLHKVESLVQDAVAKGAQVAVGGQRLRTRRVDERVVLCAHRAARRPRRHAGVSGGDLWPGGPGAHLPHGRRAHRARQCHDLWPGQLCLYAGLRADPPPRGSAGIRPGGRQRCHGLHP